MKIKTIIMNKGKIKVVYTSGEQETDVNSICTEEQALPEFYIQSMLGIALFGQHYKLPIDVIKNCNINKMEFRHFCQDTDKDPFMYKVSANLVYTPDLGVKSNIKLGPIVIPLGTERPTTGRVTDQYKQFLYQALVWGDQMQDLALAFVNGDRAQQHLDFKDFENMAAQAAQSRNICELEKEPEKKQAKGGKSK